ncbi:MAG: hypothetical protein IPH96_08735 [Saprospiraceae bacterium]|nr:hypothetical protein [Saprospiraceae bacterium]
MDSIFLKHSHPECQDHYYNLVEEVNTATFGSITVEKDLFRRMEVSLGLNFLSRKYF